MKALIGDLAVRGQGLAVGTMMGLPTSVQRLLAGPSVVADDAELAVDLQLMLKVLGLGPTRDLAGLPLEEMRDRVSRSMILAGGDQPIGSVTNFDAGRAPARLYLPSGELSSPGPLLVFFHGGGFTVGDLDSYDAVCRFLAERTSVRVASVDYRLAPEHPFPAAHDDALAAFEWIHAHAVDLDVDPRRIGVAGDSAGGNLAAAVALAARDRCRWQFLFYPATVGVGDHPSRQRFGEDFLLTREFIEASVRHYGGGVASPRGRRRAEPLLAKLPADVAPALVATAGFDPLRDEGEAYAHKLAEAGIDAELRRFGGQIHGFLSLIGISSTAREAASDVAAMIGERVHGGKG